MVYGGVCKNTYISTDLGKEGAITKFCKKINFD